MSLILTKTERHMIKNIHRSSRKATLPVLLYGRETWTTIARDARRITAA
jgi:hypothetical protein